MKNIVLSCDENYILPARVMLRSMAATNQNIKIWFVHADVSEKSIASMKKDVNGYGWEFEARKLDEEFEKPFASFPVMLNFANAMYYRLLLPWILPECERALYLDVDMMIRGDLEPLYKIELGENLLAAVLDSGGQVRRKKKKEYRLTDNYYNSGMQLLDLKRIRDWKTAEDFLQRIIDLQGSVELEYPDQDLLNILYDMMEKFLQ